MSRLVGLVGKARVGKSTILKHLQDTYPGLSFPDSTNALHVFQRAATQCPEFYGGRYLEGSSLLNPLRRYAEDYLTDYDSSKVVAEKLGNATNLRLGCIGFAELIRTVYPTFWVALAQALWYKDGTVGVSTILDWREYQQLLARYSRVDLVHLVCTNPSYEVEQDSRDTEWVKNLVHTQYVYEVENSKEVADKIYHDFILGK